MVDKKIRTRGACGRILDVFQVQFLYHCLGESALLDRRLQQSHPQFGTDDRKRNARDAVAAAERTLEKGKGKLSALAEASDEEFEKMWADTKDAWQDMSAGVERGWNKLSDRVKSFFA